MNDVQITLVSRKTILSVSVLTWAQSGIRISPFCIRTTARSRVGHGQPAYARVAQATLAFEFVTLKEVPLVPHRAEPLRASDGTVLYWIGVNVDIEERKQAEFYLAEGQRLAHMGSWAFNPAGFEYWSRELFQIYGLDPSGKPPTVEEYMGLVHPADRGFMEQGIQKMLTDRLGFDFTKRIVRPDGKIRHVRCVGVPVTDGVTFEGFVGTGMDVTEQDQLMEELRRSEFYLAEGQRLGHTGSWAFNTGGYFEHWSRELFQIYGLDPQKGAPTLDQYLATIHPQDRDFMAETIKTMQEQGSGCDVKKRIIRPDGVLRYVRCVGIPVSDNGVSNGFLGTAMDVTEQEQLTQELQRREAYLAEAQALSHTGSFGGNLTPGRSSGQMKPIASSSSIRGSS